jgi:hypothetical protein
LNIHSYKFDKDLTMGAKLKAIGTVYVEHQDEILGLLEKNPSKAIPIILQRLKTKKEQLEQHKIENNRNWKEICERNFYKSLDHRSFYFRQNEKKNTNSKGNSHCCLILIAFLQEIKQRYAEKPKSELNIKLGGSQNSRYFSSFANLGPGISHKVDSGLDPLWSISQEYHSFFSSLSLCIEK